MNIKEQIAELLPNLDAINDAEELRAIRAELREAAAGLKELSNYCEGKGHAIDCRKTGSINLAQRFEDAADAVYKRLPDWAKW